MSTRKYHILLSPSWCHTPHPLAISTTVCSEQRAGPARRSQGVCAHCHPNQTPSLPFGYVRNLELQNFLISLYTCTQTTQYIRYTCKLGTRTCLKGPKVYFQTKSFTWLWVANIIKSEGRWPGQVCQAWQVLTKQLWWWRLHWWVTLSRPGSWRSDWLRFHPTEEVYLDFLGFTISKMTQFSGQTGHSS